MSRPRPVHPGTRYLVTRRTSQREFLLRPSDLTNQVVLYALAYAAKMSGVVVHAVVAMSNHVHLVITDPFGLLPGFLHLFHRHVACCMNASLDRSENFWASDPTNVVELASDEDVLDRIAYVIANPTRAGLVEHPSQWPGVITTPEGMRATIQRPKVFFSQTGKMPRSIDLDVKPPELESYADEDAAVARLREVLGTKLSEACLDLASKNRRFLSAAAVLAFKTSATAKSPEPKTSHKPRFAAQDKAHLRQLLDRMRAFHGHYARALRAWRDGNRDVVFPAGTYLMRVRHGVFVADATG